MSSDNYCNNCGKDGHSYSQCKMPITSVGIIAYRINNSQKEYLMIRRKDTLGFIDFMRGKYSVNNKDYIMNMLKQMTQDEKTKLDSLSFDELWLSVWGNNRLSNQYKQEETVSRNKFQVIKDGIYNKKGFYNLNTLIEESKQYTQWEEPEWGFPKGRRNFQEKDYDCALREFKEETGVPVESLHSIQNIFPFEENFTGSNYKSYKHKYYITYMDYEKTLLSYKYDKMEVSKIEWKSLKQCIECMRPYNLEKQHMLTNLDNMLTYHKPVLFY